MGILDQAKAKHIGIEECGEAMEELSDRDFLLSPMYYDWGYSLTPVITLRVGLIERLRKAKDILRKTPGCERFDIKVWDGYRTLKTQKILYDNYWNELKIKHPDWTDDQLSEAVEIFVSPPSRDHNYPAPHNTGGAVDLTLVDEHGRDIPMGTAFDEFNVRSFTDHFYGEIDDVSEIDDHRAMPFSPEECKDFHRNRMLLKRVMEEAGFKNYHEEWWHFSFGDQEWAMQTGREMAIYGSMEVYPIY
ncbi:MAG: M15 family metallopeptidase [bacterium]|nr:M15 family metallopeptidase [bacterium]